MPRLSELVTQDQSGSSQDTIRLSQLEQPVQAGQGLGVMAAENPFAQLQKRVSAGEQLSPSEQKQYTATRNLLLKREAAGDPEAIDIMRQARQYQVEQMGTGERILAGAGAGFEQLGMGLKQGALNVGEKIGLVSPETSARYRTQVDIERARQEPLLNTDAGSFGKLIPDVALSIPLFRAGQAALAPKGAGALRTNVVAPATTGAGYTYFTQPVGTGESKTGQVALGAGLSAAGQLGGAGVSKAYGGRSAAVQADTVLRDQLAAAERAGITLLPRDVINTPFFNKLDAVLSNLPFSGAGKAAARRQAEINLAAGKPIGVTTPYIRPGQGLEAETARSAAGRAYDDFWKGKGISLDLNDFFSLNAAKAAINKTPIGRDQGRLASQQLDYISQIATERPLTGAEYQYIRSELKALSSDSASKPYADIALAQLDRMAKKSLSRQELKQLRQLDRRYADVKRVQSVIDASGNVSPGKLSSIVQGTMGKKPKPASAEMRNLALAGPALANPVPQGIGTAEKLVTYGSTLGIGGLGILSPLTATGAAGGLALNRAIRQPIVAQYLKGGVPAAAQRVPLVGPAMSRALPSTQTVGRVAPRTGAVFGAPLERIESDAEMKKRREELIRRQNLLYKGN